MHVSAETNRVDLIRRYELGEQAARIRGESWQGTTWHKGDAEQRRQAGPELDKLAAEHGLKREKLLERYRLYRTWPQKRFEWLVSQKREDGTALVVWCMLIDLWTNKLDDAARRQLEKQLIEKQLYSVAFTKLVRRKTDGTLPAHARVDTPGWAFRRFRLNANKFIPHFQLIHEGVSLLKSAKSSKAVEQVVSKLNKLQDQISRALRAIDQARQARR